MRHDPRGPRVLASNQRIENYLLEPLRKAREIEETPKPLDTPYALSFPSVNTIGRRP